MRKFAWLALFDISGLLVWASIICIQPQAHVKQQTENIDSLMTLIRKDPRYHVQHVLFDYKDSSLIIIIAGEECSTRYFNETYHIPAFQRIDGIKILNTNNRGLDADSKRGTRLLAAFKTKWCRDNECSPLTARIKQDLSIPESYRSLRLSIEWLDDSSFVVTNLFQLKKAKGGVITQKVQAQIDMKGNILVYDAKDLR